MAMHAKTPRYNHDESVNALFEKIGNAAPTTAVDAAWLDGLRRAALRKTVGWKDSVDAFLHGLTAAGHLSGVELAELRASLMLCMGVDSTWREFVFPIAWMVCVSVVTLACRALSIDWWFVAVIFIATAATGAIWARSRAWLKPGNFAKQARWDRPFAIVALALLVPITTVVVSALTGNAVQWLSIYRFDLDRTAFVNDPQGFPLLRAFARKNFDVDVVLGDAFDSWASTTLNLPTASIASMSLRPGYCELSMYRDNILRSFEPTGKENQTLWIQGVMMHEFGHCLDVLRDFPNFGKHTVKVDSIAPMDAKNVSDLQSYLSATKEHSTKIWREALADIFAVGYWRLVAPSEAKSLAAHLWRKRGNAAQDDSSHATMCWIEQAINSMPPVSEKDLFTWAEHQRSVALCTTQKPSKRISAFVKLKDFLGLGQK